MRISSLDPAQVRYGCRKKDVVKSARLLLLVLTLVFMEQALVAQIPLVTVDPATHITSTAAGITGTVNPQGQPAGCFVQWGATTAYGYTSPPVRLPAATEELVVSNNMIGLSPNTTYHFRLAATNSSGTGYSPDMMLTTPSGPIGQPPTAVTLPVSAITTTSANLWGTVGSVGVVGGYYFRWGLDANYGNTTASGFIPINQQFSTYQSLGGLSPGTTYHFQIVATNSAGSAFGADQAFTTQGFFTNGVHVFTYLVTNNAITITAYSGPGGEVPIPGAIVGLPVTTVGGFAGQNTVTSILIPNGVTALDSGAFGGTGLTNLTLPDSLMSIGDNAFNECSGLTKVVIPNSVTNVGDTAFYGCSSLTDLTIGNHVTYLGRQVFGFCQQLTRVVIPDSVTRIEDGNIFFGGPIGVLWGCNNLTNVTVGSGLAYLGYGAFAYCPNLTGVYFRGNTPALSWGGYGERMFDNSSEAIIVE
jgi:BspA type Leucine rich repeat region (6 copies)